MDDITVQRVNAYVEWVEQTQPKDVVDAFKKELAGCRDRASSNLTIMLNNARMKSPNAQMHRAQERAMLNNSRQYFNS